MFTLPATQNTDEDETKPQFQLAQVTPQC